MNREQGNQEAIRRSKERINHFKTAWYEAIAKKKAKESKDVGENNK